MIRRSSIGLARTTLICLLFLFGICGGTARATLFDFSYIGTTVNITAVISAVTNGDGSYTAQSATGAWNGSAISLISTTGPGWGGNQNILYPSGASYAYYVDYNGIAFQSASGDQVNVYFDSGSSSPVYQYSAYTSLTGPTQFDINGTVSLTMLSAPGPTPGGGAISLLGLGLCFAGARMKAVGAWSRALRARVLARVGAGAKLAQTA